MVNLKEKVPTFRERSKINCIPNSASMEAVSLMERALNLTSHIYVPCIIHCEQKISVTYASDKAERANVLNIAEWMMNDNKTHAVCTPYHYELSLFDI